MNEPHKIPPCWVRDPEMWFPSTRAGAAVAQALCRDCPIIAECRELAMKAEGSRTAGGRYGIYGGLDTSDRARLARKRAKNNAPNQ